MQLGDPAISKEKLEQAVKLMQENNIDTWLLLTREGTDPSIPLLVSVRSVHLAAIFIRSNGKHVVLTSASDFGSYKETDLFHEVRQYGTNVEKEFLDLFNELDIQKLALNISESDHLCDGLTGGLYQWLSELIGVETLERIEVSSEKMLKKIRSIKSPEEIKRIKEAVKLTDEIYEAVFKQVKAGMSEKEMGQLFVEEMKKRGVTNGLGHAFDPPMVCAVSHGLAHRQPSDYVIKPGDIVIFDFSLKYKDYVSDIARTIYFLEPDEEDAPADIKHAFDTAIKAIHETIGQMKPGMKGFEIDAIGRRVIEEAGYPTIRHSVGHQIGRNTHDGGTILGPQRIPKRPEVEAIIQVGEVYAVEPTVIQDGGLPCILVEENVLLTEDGAELLSQPQKELVLISS